MSNASRTLSVQSPAIPLVLGLPALEPVRLSGREGPHSRFEYKTPSSLCCKHGTAGSWQEHAALHAQVGPMRRPVNAPEFAQGQFNGKASQSSHKFSPSA